MQRAFISKSAGCSSLLCFAAACVLGNSRFQYDYSGTVTTLSAAALLLPVVAAVTGSKLWLLVWVLLLFWVIYAVATTPMVRM